MTNIIELIRTPAPVGWSRLGTSIPSLEDWGIRGRGRVDGEGGWQTAHIQTDKHPSRSR